MIYGGVEINTHDYRGPVVYIGDEPGIEFQTLAEAYRYIEETEERNYEDEDRDFGL